MTLAERMAAAARQALEEGASKNDAYKQRPRVDGSSSEDETDAKVDSFIKRLRNGARIVP